MPDPGPIGDLLLTLAGPGLRAALPCAVAAAITIVCRRRLSAAQVHAVLMAGVLTGALSVPLHQVLPSWQVLPATSGAASALPLQEFRASERSGLLVLWILGALVCAGPLFLAAISLRRIEAAASTCRDTSLRERFFRERRLRGLSDRVRLLLDQQQRMPMSWGWRRPVVLLPEAAIGWPRDRQRAILAHELSHLQRRDSLSTVIARLAVSIQWFNPFAWWAYRRLLAERERAADDLALRTQRSEPVYAESILAVVARHLSVPVFEPAAVAHAGAARGLERRLRSVLAPGTNRAAMGAPARVLVAALAIAGGTLAASIGHREREVRAAFTAREIDPPRPPGEQAAGPGRARATVTAAPQDRAGGRYRLAPATTGPGEARARIGFRPAGKSPRN